jgi:hypothetical protein
LQFFCILFRVIYFCLHNQVKKHAGQMEWYIFLTLKGLNAAASVLRFKTIVTVCLLSVALYV